MPHTASASSSIPATHAATIHAAPLMNATQELQLRALDIDAPVSVRLEAATKLLSARGEFSAHPVELDRRSLQNQAEAIGLEIKTHRAACALSFLAPEIVTHAGIRPNPSHADRTLYAHMEHGYSGANLVRLAWFPGSADGILCQLTNPAIDEGVFSCLRSEDLTYHDLSILARHQYQGAVRATIHYAGSAPEQFRTNSFETADRTLKEHGSASAQATLYEYVLQDIEGVHVNRPMRGLEISRHDAVWSRGVDPSQIVGVREIKVTAVWQGLNFESGRPQLSSLQIDGGGYLPITPPSIDDLREAANRLGRRAQLRITCECEWSKMFGSSKLNHSKLSEALLGQLAMNQAKL